MIRNERLYVAVAIVVLLLLAAFLGGCKESVYRDMPIPDDRAMETMPLAELCDTMIKRMRRAQIEHLAHADAYLSAHDELILMQLENRCRKVQ